MLTGAESDVSETDSFIEEVSEEVRRDRLYGYVRRYGWIAVVAVLLLVGGASYNEYRKAQVISAAQAKGDAILSALEKDPGADRLAELEGLDPSVQSSPVVAMLLAGEALEAEDPGAAADALQAVIDDAEQPQLYRDLALLKRVILTSNEVAPDARISTLSALTTPGSTFRVLAEEQIALAELEKGDREAAIARLRALLVDVEASQGLRVRAQQLIVALGEDVDPA